MLKRIIGYYQDKQAWAKERYFKYEYAGKFSSDRTIQNAWMRSGIWIASTVPDTLVCENVKGHRTGNVLRRWMRNILLRQKEKRFRKELALMKGAGSRLARRFRIKTAAVRRRYPRDCRHPSAAQSVSRRPLIPSQEMILSGSSQAGSRRGYPYCWAMMPSISSNR